MRASCFPNWKLGNEKGARSWFGINTYIFVYVKISKNLFCLILFILVWSCSDWFGSCRSQMWWRWCIWVSFEQRIRNRNWNLQCYCTQDLQTSSLLSSTQQCTYSSHVFFTNPEFSIYCLFDIRMIVISMTSLFAQKALRMEIFAQEFEPASYFCDWTCVHLIMRWQK